MKLRVRELREACGISQEDAAERLGVSGATLSRIENNSQNTKLTVLNAMANLYGVAVPELFEYDGRNPLMQIAWSIPPDQAPFAADLLEAFERQIRRARLSA